MSINFYFNWSSQRYHYSEGEKKGQFLGKNQVRELVLDYLNRQKDKAREINEKLFNNKISLGDWELEQAKLIKTSAIASYKIGNPKLGNGSKTDAEDYGRIGRYLRDEYLYLRNFSREIANGNLTQNQINARINLYLERCKWAFEEGKRYAHKRAGYRWEMRLLGIAEHCSQCLYYAQLGWQPIGSLPGITTKCDCKSNDKCRFEYSKSLTKPQERLLQSIGWIS